MSARPARLDDELLVTAALRETGRASLTIAQQALLRPDAGPGAAAPAAPAADPVVLCEGTIRIGWVEAATTAGGSRSASVTLLTDLGAPRSGRSAWSSAGSIETLVAEVPLAELAHSGRADDERWSERSC